jgi:hypothetical protein
VNTADARHARGEELDVEPVNLAAEFVTLTAELADFEESGATGFWMIAPRDRESPAVFSEDDHREAIDMMAESWRERRSKGESDGFPSSEKRWGEGGSEAGVQPRG